MYKGGRPTDPIWDQYHRVTQGNKVSAQCRRCNHILTGKVARMKTHHAKCLAKPDQASVTQPTPDQRSSTPLLTTIPEHTSEPVTRPQPQKRPASSPPPAGPPPKRQQTCLDGHVLFTTDSTKSSLDEKVAEMVYGCNLPFAIVEHPLFKDLVSALRPGYKPPTRKQLGSTLLDQVHNKHQSRMQNQLKDKIVTMQQDGWSTQQNDPVVATSVSSETKSFFIDAKDTGSNHKTGTHLKEMFLDSKTKAEQTYGCKVKSFVTDNAKNMDKMRREVEQELPDIITYGCLAHVFNLLGIDLTPTAVMKHVVEINKIFRNHHIPSSWLNNHPDAKRPTLPSETRWKGQLMCLESYIHNRTYYIQFIQDFPGEIDAVIMRKIMDMNLWGQIRDSADILRPVARALDRSQRDKTTIADAPEIFFDLLEDPALQDHKDKIQKRFDFVIRPCHLAANLFHPDYMGQRLTLAQVETVKTWLMEKNPDFLATAVAFQAEAHPFPQSYFQPGPRKLNPVTWWKAVSSKNADIPDSFLDLMLTLHTATASSSSLERIFSTFGLVMSKLRNKLGLDKAQKLVFCYRMLRGPCELDY